MKKVYTVLFIIFSITLTVNLLPAQSIEELNKFKYINVPRLEYYVVSAKNAGATVVFDVYGIQKIIKNTLLTKGFLVLEFNEVKAAVSRENCEIGHCFIQQNSNLDPNRFDEIVIYFSDCNYKVVYKCEAKVTSLIVKKVTTAIPLGISAMQQATKDALKEFSEYDYDYDADKTIVKTEFAVSQLDKKEIRSYFKNELNELDVLEGIYESLDVDFYYVKLAVVKKAEWFDLIILESDNISWESMQIRGKVKLTKDDKYTGNWLYTNDEESGLEIEKGKRKRVYNFRFIDSASNEYFEIEFKKKFP